MAIHLTPEANPTVQEGTLYVDSATGEFNVAGRTTPHIIPGVLYPAVAGNDINGTDIDTSHGSTYTYGTAHTDGRKYYYTDIKGSKPIKDPRIGGHFGSQRYRFSSAQLLEQETATQGDNVYSIDGREWIRGVGDVTGSYNNSHGTRTLLDNTSSYFEIVGYFSSINIASYAYDNAKFRYSLDGASEVGTDYGPISTVATPLGSRYVKAGSLVNIPISTTLGIHTIKLRNNHGTAASSNEITDIELIAQDTTSTATKSKIQIPSQNVVSYGKKFTVSDTPHYDPFTTMSYGGSGTTLSALQSLIDTDTSLGMDAWKAGTSNYHRPWNGGRIIKWVDSSGTIKTSVNIMPPNAQNMSTTASNAVSDAHVIAGTNDDTINFNTSAIDHSQAEVAKTFHFREFGNGSANGGTGSANYADASMLSTSSDDIAYVMDDGLTSLSGDDVHMGDSGNVFVCYGDGDYWHVTFIGTGISFTSLTWGAGTHQIAQNLPYGTHILKCYRDSDAHPVLTIDGVDVQGSSDIGTYGNMNELTFHQPKKPPIPEDACVIADYMLMADFVAIGATGIDKISKGVRYQGSSRDVFYDGSAWTLAPSPTDIIGGFQLSRGNDSTNNLQKIPFFGSGINSRFTSNSSNGAETSFTNNGTNFISPTAIGHFSSNAINQSSGTASGDYGGVSGLSLGTYTVQSKLTSTSGTKYQRADGWEIATPIHTSSHYQSFETPFLHELVGGDRNMEQTNLVVSPDGKTWDEVTRDTSYIGNLVVSANTDTTQTWNSVVVLDEWRGGGADAQFKDQFNKYFAIAYDQLICLKDGDYRIETTGTHDGEHQIDINDAGQTRSNSSHSGLSWLAKLSRGDRIKLYADWGTGALINNHFYITKL